MLAAVSSVHAAPPALRLAADADLRFGNFVVVSSGARTVSASGAVTNNGVIPVSGGVAGPARFTVSYDRGNNGNRAIDVTIQVVLMSVPAVTQSGVVGSLSAFDSDLADAKTIVPGQVVTITIAGCRTRVCSKTFQVGARLDVKRSSGGASLNIPLPMVATTVAVTNS